MLPSSDFIGMGDVRDALLCAFADSGIRGVVVRGPPGTGKSEMVRSVCTEAFGSVPLTIPQSSTAEQVFGSLDLERALATGEVSLEPGILGRAGDGVVLIDDANLLDRQLLRQVMDSVASGTVRVERDGLSATYRCGATVVATVNSREAPLDRAVSDLFDICVDVRPPSDPEARARISGNCILGDGEAAYDPGLAARVSEARAMIGMVVLGDRVLAVIAESADAFGCRGQRGGISAARTARALAALDGRDEATLDDAGRAAVMCLSHRRGRVARRAEDNDRVELFGDSHIRRAIHDDRKAEPSPDEPPSGVAEPADADAAQPAEDREVEDVVQEVGEVFEAVDLMEDARSRNDPTSRRMVRDTGREGRYVSARPLREGSDIAVDATVRAAAPYQRERRERLGTDRVVVLPQDLMGKVRERRTSCLFLFMIDNSGSLVIRSRMRAVKGAVLSILADHYGRRDSVAVMTFNEEYVGMVMRPTRSVGYVKGVLEDIPAGRKTPLSEALVRAEAEASSYLRKRPADRCFIILMTDGKANLPLSEGEDPFSEALRIASGMRIDRTGWALVDTAANPDSEHRPERVAEALGASFYRLDDLRL